MPPWTMFIPNTTMSPTLYSAVSRRLAAEYNVGDVIVFGMNIVHGGMDNRSHRLQLSSDSRYQLAAEPVDERWIREDPPGHSSAGKRGRIC